MVFSSVLKVYVRIAIYSEWQLLVLRKKLLRQNLIKLHKNNLNHKEICFSLLAWEIVDYLFSKVVSLLISLLVLCFAAHV